MGGATSQEEAHEQRKHWPVPRLSFPAQRASSGSSEVAEGFETLAGPSLLRRVAEDFETLLRLVGVEAVVAAHLVLQHHLLDGTHGVSTHGRAMSREEEDGQRKK